MHDVSRNSCMVMACHALEPRNSVHHAKIKLIKKYLCVVLRILIHNGWVFLS